MPDLYLGAVLRHARKALARHAVPTADALLLERFAQHRDEMAFAELVARHGPGVWAACRRGTANEADAEDVFQATFLVLARRVNQVRKASSIGSWLFGVAVRLSRKTRVRAARAPEANRLSQPRGASNPAEGTSWREVVTVLDEELARLPENLRAPLLCCYYAGLTQDEAASRLGWKVRTLKARVDRGRKLLRGRLARRGVDLSAVLAAVAVASDGMSSPPVGVLEFAGRSSLNDPVSAPVLTLVREGLAMTHRKASLVLAACAVVLVAAGAGYGLGQGKPPMPPGPPAGTPATAAVAKTDLAGDPLPPGAIARLGTTRYRLRDWLPQSFLVRDGLQLIWMAQDKTVTIMDVETGKATESFRDPDLLISRVSDLSPDGSRLAQFGSVRSDKGQLTQVLQMYDLKARKTVWAVRPDGTERTSGTAIRFTPDGRRLITLFSPGDVRVWDVANGDQLRREKFPEDSYQFQLSPDGKTIVLGRLNLYVWDWESDRPARKIDPGPRRTSFDDLQFSADGKTVYVTTNGGAAPKGYDVATGLKTGSLELGDRADWFSFSPDGRTVAFGRSPNRTDAGNRPSEIILKDLVTGKEVRRLTADPARPSGAYWSKDGSRLVSFASHQVVAWDVRTGKRLGADLQGHDGVLSSVAFAPDGRLFTTAHDRSVRAWDPATGKPLMTLQMDTDWIPGLAVSPDGWLVATSGLRNNFQIWDAKTGKEVFRLLGHGQSGGVRKLRFSTDEQTLLSWGDDWCLRTFDTLTGKLKSEHRFIPKELVGADDDDEEILIKMDASGNNPRLADLGPDGKTLALARGKDVFVYEATGKERFRVEVDAARVEKLALSVDGKWLVAAGTGAATGFAPARVNPDEARQYQVTVWDMATATVVVKFPVPTKTGLGVLAFTPDGRQVLTGSWDKELVFWDAKSGAPVGTIDLPNRPECVAFDPPGKRLVVGFLDTTALVYDLATALKPARKP